MLLVCTLFEVEVVCLLDYIVSRKNISWLNEVSTVTSVLTTLKLMVTMGFQQTHAAAWALFWNVHAMGCIQLQLSFATLTNNKCMIKHLTTSIASIIVSVQECPSIVHLSEQGSAQAT